MNHAQPTLRRFGLGALVLLFFVIHATFHDGTALVHLDATQQFEKVIDAIRATPAETAEDLADLEGDEAMTRRALDRLGASKADAYDAALTVLREDTRHWWEGEVLARRPR